MEPTPGERLWKIETDSKGHPQLYASNFVRRSKNGWIRYRNISTGKEWSERGDDWSSSVKSALTKWVKREGQRCWEFGARFGSPHDDMVGPQGSLPGDVWAEEMIFVINTVDRKLKEQFDA
jgi:hypothetical protein